MVTVAVLAVAGASMSLMHTLVVPLLPELPRLMGTSITATSWVATVTLVSGAVATPVLGRMGDMYGKRRMVLAGLGIAFVGSLLAAVAGSLHLLLVGRALQGMGVGVIPLALGILRDELPPSRFAAGVALVSALTLGIGTGLGPLVTGMILNAYGWHAVFWFASALTGLSIVLVLALVMESPIRAPAIFDWPGAAGITLALIALLLAITRGGEWGWSSPLTIGLLVASITIGWMWVAWERRHPAPLVDVATSSNGAVVITHLAGLLLGFIVFIQFVATFALVRLPAETGYGLGESVLVACATQAPGAIAMALAALLASRISRSHSPRVALIGGFALIAIGFAFGAWYHATFLELTLAATVIYAGSGLVYSAIPLVLMANVPITETGAANAVNALARVIGSSVGTAAAAAILASSVVEIGGVELPSQGAFVALYVLGGLAAIVAAVVIASSPASVHRFPARDAEVGTAPDDEAAVELTEPAVRSAEAEAGG
jgi:MFS family permease